MTDKPQADPLTDRQLDEIEARADAATNGPWRVDIHAPTLNRLVCSEDGTLDIGFGYVGNRTEPDAEFVARARMDVPALLAEVRRLRAVPSAPADRAALLGSAADRFEERAATLTDGIDVLAAFVAKARMRDAEVWKAAATLLRAMADCPWCNAGIEHTVHCPTPETHNWGCGCPTDPVPTDGPSRMADEAQQPETRQSCVCGQDGCEYCDVDEADQEQPDPCSGCRYVPCGNCQPAAVSQPGKEA